MESIKNDDDESSLSTIKRLRSQLESRIETQHTAQLDLLASLQSIVPNIVSSLDLSLQIVSSFNQKPFTPTPPIPAPTKKIIEIPNSVKPSSNSPSRANSKPLNSNLENTKLEKSNSNSNGDDNYRVDDSGSPLSVVRVMVAECLLQRVPFDPIDSSTVLRKLENDQNSTAAEKAALREVGGESGAILAVEMSLRSMAEENRGIELEEFVVSGKSRVTVLNTDRTRLVRELPESAKLESLSPSDLNPNQSNSGSNVDLSNNGGFGMGGPVMQRPVPGDMWMGGGSSGGDMWNGPPRGGMGPRGMMLEPRGMLQSPPLGPNNVQLSMQKSRTEEDDMKDLEALVNKKSFMEIQKSKTGKELLDLIHRPTAKETAVAAKVVLN